METVGKIEFEQPSAEIIDLKERVKKLEDDYKFMKERILKAFELIMKIVDIV